MAGKMVGRLAAIVVMVWLLAPERAGAWPLLDWFHKSDCPPAHYSCLHYTTPTLVKAYECVHGPKVCVYPPDRAPGVPPSYATFTYPCKTVDPVQLTEERKNIVFGQRQTSQPEK
jgi:hypothetical protein